MTKKLILAALALLVSLCCLAGCAAERETSYTVTLDHHDYLVDTEAGTVTYYDLVYEYEFSGNRKDSGQVSITFPDGKTYTESWSKGGSGVVSSTGSWSGGEMTIADHQQAQTLLRVLEEEAPYAERSSGKQYPVLLSVILIALGAFMLLAPEAAWKLNIGWQFKNAEPSKAALTFTGAAGVLLLAAGIISLFF